MCLGAGRQTEKEDGWVLLLLQSTQYEQAPCKLHPSLLGLWSHLLPGIWLVNECLQAGIICRADRNGNCFSSSCSHFLKNFLWFRSSPSQNSEMWSYELERDSSHQDFRPLLLCTCPEQQLTNSSLQFVDVSRHTTTTDIQLQTHNPLKIHNALFWS